MTPMRHDLASLLDAARAGRPWHLAESCTHCAHRDRLCVTWAIVAAELGVNGRTLSRWREAGTVPEARCDDLATAIGLHPIEVWPDYLGPGAKVCVECSTRYIPARSDQRYCTKACRERVAQRKYRQTPKGREKSAQQMKEWRARNAYSAAQNAAYYRKHAEERKAGRRARYAANAEAERARQREYDRGRRAAARVRRAA